MENTTNKKICIISLTYNRPWYVERSFDSLYSRANHDFDHYVFDDCSDEETTRVLKKLERKYNFKLIQNKTRLGIFKNFHKNVREIPMKYDFYMKFDSDIEVLSDNFLPQLLDVADMPATVSAISPRVEGMFNSQRLDSLVQRVEFYNGHAIRNVPVIYGCCLFFSKLAFESFPTMTDRQLSGSAEQYAIDSKLYEHALRIGKSVVVEDLSVYHIDNTYGQRCRDMEYFTSRNRWPVVDKNEVWFLRASKDIYPRHLKRSTLELLKNSNCINYGEFLKSCVEALEYGIDDDKNNLETEKIAASVRHQDPSIKIDVYKITAPENFAGASKHLQKGSIAYFKIIPDWARDDTSVVIEKVRMTVQDAMQVITN